MINTQLFTVAKAGNLTQIALQCEWLPRMGFVPGSLIKVIPDEDGINFILCDENIARYSALLQQTEECGGKLVVVGKIIKGETIYSAVQLVLGRKIKTSEWIYGNPLVAIYEYGIIRVRKLPVARYHTIGSAYDNRVDKTFTSLRLQADWLNDFGFTPNAIATAIAEQGRINIKLWNDGAEKYNELVKYARANGGKLFQLGTISQHIKTPSIIITGAFIDNAGFAVNDIFSVEASYGSLQLQKLSLVGYGLLMT
jgi:hypothetical protein